jgi:ADP-L-glycero-D-manno-heptose 6-epimerase
MKLLITGYKGFIGSNIVATVEKEHQVYTYEWNDPEINLNHIDWVIHIGGISSTTERDVDKIMRQNYDFSCRLLDNCLNNGVHFQYASSASVYGLNLEFAETSLVDPKTPYAWSK